MKERAMPGAAQFQTAAGLPVPAITAAQMREVDRIAVEAFGLGLLQMMENAGRTLAGNALEMLATLSGEVTILAGAGGNGGGGLCCARHLHNRGLRVNVLLDHEPEALGAAAAAQLRILQAAGVHPLEPSQAESALRRADLVIDALIGYSLRGAPRGQAADLIAACNAHAARVLALDVPSGLDATTGDAPGLVIRAARTLTLALPKTGLRRIPGALYLADIGIPPEVYRRLGLAFASPFGTRYWVQLCT
jgi:NAD(P)H-hydrate epimerase